MGFSFSATKCVVSKYLKIQAPWILFVDNETARIIAVKRRVNLKNSDIFKVARFISYLMSFGEINCAYEIIPTHENVISDLLSRCDQFNLDLGMDVFLERFIS